MINGVLDLTFIGLLDVKKSRGSGVLGAWVVLLVGVKYDRQGFVALSYFALGCGTRQVEHSTVSHGELRRTHEQKN